MRRLSPPNATPARFSATTVIACVALALSGCAVGILLGRWTAPSSLASDHSVEAAAPQPDMRPILQEIRHALERPLEGTRDGHESPPASPSVRETVVPPPEAFERLTAAVERLSRLLERGGTHVARGTSAQEAWKGRGYPSLDAMWQRIDALHGADPRDRTGPVNKELTDNHLAWIREDVFERYGAPTAVYPGERGMGVIYKRDAKPEDPSTIQFLINEGLVVYITIDR